MLSHPNCNNKDFHVESSVHFVAKRNIIGLEDYINKKVTKVTVLHEPKS